MDDDIAPNADFKGIFGSNRLAANHLLHACHPINECVGLALVQEKLLDVLVCALGRYETRVDIAMQGIWKGRSWTASSGHLLGRFVAPLFGVQPTSHVVYIRFGCFQRWEGRIVVETILMLDLPSLMMQAGAWPLRVSTAPDLMAPPPRGGAGIATKHDGAESLAIVEAMVGGLMKYDGSLKTMNMRDYFAEDFWWFGPGPIGSLRGFEDYERGHARPFLTAFPDRVGGNHLARFGDGELVASTGWPSITATHLGAGWLGLEATGRAVTMRVMDFWRADDGFLAENWVMIDIPDLLKQIDVDVFEPL